MMVPIIYIQLLLLRMTLSLSLLSRHVLLYGYERKNLLCICFPSDNKNLFFYNFFTFHFKFCRYWGRNPPSIRLFPEGNMLGQKHIFMVNQKVNGFFFDLGSGSNRQLPLTKKIKGMNKVGCILVHSHQYSCYFLF